MGIAVVLGIFLLACISGFISMYIASARGHTSSLFFWVGFFLPIVGLLVAFLTPLPVADPPHQTQPQSQPQPSNTTLTDQLNDLAKLHQSGELSDGEYQAAKKQIIDNPN